MRHDPIDVLADGSAGQAGRSPRRPATRRPQPVDLGVEIVATEDAGAALAREVLDPSRTVPVVCLSTRVGEDRPAIDVRAAREALGRGAELRAVRTGPASRALSADLPPHLGVFGGAARIWWPGLDQRSDPRAHPLVLDRTGRYGRRSVQILAERFADGAPAGPAPAPTPEREERTPPARLVALPGGEERDDVATELADARAELRRLRAKLAEVRVDGMEQPPARPSAVDRPDGAPQVAGPQQLARLSLPAAVTRDRERRHHLEITAAWLARDTDEGRRALPIGPFALGVGYLDALDALDDPALAATAVVIAARIASGKVGEADDLAVRAAVSDEGTDTQDVRDEDGAAGWSCALDPADPDGPRLRWWTRDDGAVELRDVVRG